MADDKLEYSEDDKFLRFKVIEGFKRWDLPISEEYIKRIDYEGGIIAKMKYATYFLIVADLCRFMRDNDILFVVRGSGCGSCYVWGLGISHKWLDPIKYGLPFERFLNPARISMPDLDIDIDDTRRNEVVEYTIRKYGKDRVAKIITFGTLAAKNAIKDVGRAMQYPDYDRIAAEINAFIPAGKGEDGKNIRLADELRRNEGLREYQRKYPEWFKLAMRVEGKIRNASIHAAGTIITPDRMTKFLPTIFWGNPAERSEDEWFPCTQWDMYDTEDRGLLKMDYLGLKTLRVIAKTCKAINVVKKALGHTDKFDINEIDRHDPKAWQLLSEGRTACVFQIEKSFVQGYARRMNLASLRDPWQLAVLVAIIRPGMMDGSNSADGISNTEHYLRRASSQEPTSAPHPTLEKTFAKTYGLMCFQEDVMWAAQDFAGFTMGEADVLRKGVGKKNPEFIAKMFPKFSEGAQLKGATLEEIEKIWSNIEAHSRYSFNNAHAAAYGMIITYWTAYLKANWPLLFMMNAVNAESGSGNKEDGYNYKVAEYVEESRSMGITVLGPCVKRSAHVCSIVWDKNQIRFGLSLIKKLSAGGVEWIVSHAKKANSFKDFVLAGYEIVVGTDGIDKPKSRINKTDLESLILSGAMDCFESGNRSKMMAMLPTTMELAKKYHEQAGKVKAGKTKLRLKPEDLQAELAAFNLEDGSYPEITLERRLELEQEVTGCFLSESPFQPYRDVIHKCCDSMVGDIRFGISSSETMVFAGVMNRLTKTIIKNGKNRGEEMGFLGFTGIDGASIEAVAFSKVWATINDHQNKPGELEKGKVFIASVRRDRDRPDSYIINDVTRLSNCGFDGR